MRCIDADRLKFTSYVNGDVTISKELVDAAPAVDVVHRVLYDQTAWERDVALKQLSDIGKGLGEKMDDVRKVVHAHWEWFEEWSKSNTEHFSECEDAGWRCSGCKVPLEESTGCLWDDMGNKPRVKYCPNCGADMRGDYD